MRRLPALLLTAALLAGCSDDDSSAADDGAAPTSTESTTTTTAAPTTSEPAGDLPTVTPAPDGAPANAADPAVLEEAGYSQTELFVAGEARSYRLTSERTEDGAWDVEPAETADYVTRIIVRQPTDPDDFSGTVVVEWNNVTIGSDGTPDWTFTSSELLRRGHAYVAVSAQEVGVHGFPEDASGGFAEVLGPGGGLVDQDPDRYGDLVHPGDQYSYDIYGDVAALLRAGEVLADGTVPDHVIAIGESQSAFRLVTYVDAVHAFAPYDGYLIHSRGGGAARLDATELTDGIFGGIRIRADLDVPVLTFSTETDVQQLGYAAARQPDTDVFRSWEVAGTAHADATLLGGDPAAGQGLGCPGLVNDGPQGLVLRAALAALVDWVVDGTVPEARPPLELATEDPIQIARDDDGNAIGGIRTPAVEVPVATLTGDPAADSGLLCSLFGQTIPFDAATLAARYGTPADYVAAVEAGVDDAVAGGVILADDAEAVRSQAGEVDIPA